MGEGWQSYKKGFFFPNNLMRSLNGQSDGRLQTALKGVSVYKCEYKGQVNFIQPIYISSIKTGIIGTRVRSVFH